MKKIVLTGIYRSGTTLLDKVLNCHPEVATSSQPFSSLFFDIKKLFLRSKGIQRSYPIGPDFMDDGNLKKSFFDFLNSHRLSSDELDELLNNLASKGHLKAVPVELRSGLSGKNFNDILEKLVDLLISRSLKKPTAVFGVKEILCEEYIPYFISHDIKSIIIIRDPRDIICSLNLGKGKEFTGEMRPLLYSLRLWRKSVAYAIKYNGSPDFKFIKYEDLVSDTAAVMNKMTSFLSVTPFTEEEYANPLRDQNQNSWMGNSSFSDYDVISPKSIGNYKTRMSKAEIQYIENVCKPEMVYLGYHFENEKLDIKEIRSFNEPFSITRENFPSDFSSSKENISMEINRIQALMDKSLLTVEEQERIFLFPEVYMAFKKNY